MIWSLLSHETLIFNYIDLPWVHKKAKELISAKQNAYKFYIQNSKDIQIFYTIENLQNHWLTQL